MPPHSKTLAEEGAAFKSFLIVEQGTFNETEIIKRLTTSTNAPGATGTRNLADNLSDLKAQIAANQKGIQLVSELINSYGLNVVQAYMDYIQQNAELAVRDMLREIARNTKERFVYSNSFIGNTTFYLIIELVQQFLKLKNLWMMDHQLNLK